MVYKIKGDFNEKTFKRILDKIRKQFSFIYSDGLLYVAQLSYKDVEEKFEYLRRSLSEIGKLNITKLDETNLASCPQEIIEWARNNFVMLEREKYETEKQDQLLYIWHEMDKLDAKLQEQLAEKLSKRDAVGNK